MSKVQGTVLWFNNRKGFGFLKPTSDNSPTKEEIFVHQTSIYSDGAYRTLVEKSEVEFDVEKEESTGKWKAVNVTAPGGGSLQPPPKKERRQRKPHEDDDDEDKMGGEAEAGDKDIDMKAKKPIKPRGGRNGRGPPREAKPREPTFHEHLSDEIKDKVQAKGVELGSKSTVDVAIGNARIKLGQGGYAGLADASGKVGEGTYTCDDKGLVSFTWERAIEFTSDGWQSCDTASLPATLSLPEDNIGPVKPDETPETLWGADKPDPKDAFEANGFKMRRVVLTRAPGTGRPRRAPRKQL